MKLFEPIKIGNVELKNRVIMAPMENGMAEVGTGEVTDRIIAFFEERAQHNIAMIMPGSIGVSPEGRGLPTQLSLFDEKQVAGHKRLVDAIHSKGSLVAAQLYHAGRQASEAITGLDPLAPSAIPCGILQNHPKEITHEQMNRIKEQFRQAARWSIEAGYDIVEVHFAHGYLLHSFMSTHTNHRTDEYGGSFENRTRLLRNGIQAAKAYETDQFLVTARIGIYDGFAYPYGFGVKEGEGIIPNLEEPIRLIRELHEDYQMPMVNLTMGNPYVSIHVTRPYDMGKYIPDEHPLYGIARMIHGIGEVKKAVPQMAISASAPTYLRQYSDLYAAGAIEEGLCDQMLFGRLSFADPDFPNQIRDTGRIDPKKVCVTCGKCGDLIRAGKPTGCVVRNPENYLKYYREYQEENR